MCWVGRKASTLLLLLREIMASTRFQWTCKITARCCTLATLQESNKLIVYNYVKSMLQQWSVHLTTCSESYFYHHHWYTVTIRIHKHLTSTQNWQCTNQKPQTNPFISTFVAKMSLPKHSAPYWSNTPFLIFLTFRYAPQYPNVKCQKTKIFVDPWSVTIWH